MLPKRAVEEFKLLLLNAGIELPDSETDLLAKEFLAFMKIILKGGVKNEKQ